MVSKEVVTPLKNGVQSFLNSSEALDSGFRRNDRKRRFRTFYDFINFAPAIRGNKRYLRRRNADFNIPSFRRRPESSRKRVISLEKQPAVYLLASKRNGTLYVGVTSDLIKRVWEHKNDLVEGFTKRYGVHRLVWYEIHNSMESAIKREKSIKGWKRAWKLELIESGNPDWEDLYYTII